MLIFMINLPSKFLDVIWNSLLNEVSAHARCRDALSLGKRPGAEQGGAWCTHPHSSKFKFILPLPKLNK